MYAGELDKAVIHLSRNPSMFCVAAICQSVAADSVDTRPSYKVSVPPRWECEYQRRSGGSSIRAYRNQADVSLPAGRAGTRWNVAQSVRAAAF